MTAHPAASAGRDGEDHVGSDQWRVLRFNAVTRQSVNRVRLRRDGHEGKEEAEARPECLAFPYLRTMASSGGQSQANSAYQPPSGEPLLALTHLGVRQQPP